MVLSGGGEAGKTKNMCQKGGSNEEHFYSVLTETAGKWRYKERSDRVEKEESERRDLRTAYYLHAASLL